MKEFVREIGHQIDDPHNPPKRDGPPSEEEMARMMESIGRHMETLPSGRMLE